MTALARLVVDRYGLHSRLSQENRELLELAQAELSPATAPRADDPPGRRGFAERTPADLGLEATRPVWLAAVYPAVPIAHGIDGLRRAGPISETRTRCGIVLYRWTPATRETYEAAGHWLPARHALRFARPCRRCWP